MTVRRLVACVSVWFIVATATAAVPASTGRLAQLAGRAGCLTTDMQPGCERASGVDAATGIVVSADGRSAYVAGLASLGVFARNGSTGTLVQASGAAGCIQDPAPTWHAHRHCTSAAGLWPTDL